MKGTIKVLNASGHTEVAYDTEDITEAGKAAVREAEQILARAVAGNSMLFDTITRERISTRSPAHIPVFHRLQEHPDVTVVPPMAGG